MLSGLIGWESSFFKISLERLFGGEIKRLGQNLAVKNLHFLDARGHERTAQIEKFVRTVFYFVVNLRLVAAQLLYISGQEKLLAKVEVLEVQVEHSLGEGIINFFGLVVPLGEALQHGANQHLVLGRRGRVGPAE